MQRYRHFPQTTVPVPPVPPVHAPVPGGADVPTVPRGAGFPILDDTALQGEGVPLDRLEVRVSEAAQRARMGYSPYAARPVISAPPEHAGTGRKPWWSHPRIAVPRRLAPGMHAAA